MPDLLLLPSVLKSPVAVVCHDAGAANLIFAWLREWFEAGQLNQHEFKLVLQGPAKKAWLNNPVPLQKLQLHTSLNIALQGCSSVLTGTGWASNLEHQARLTALSLGIPSIAVIDHWVNYALRFERDGVVVLPSQIWVSDAEAARTAQAQFQGIPVLELPNVYLKQLVKDIPPVPADCSNLLYVLEPLRNDWGRGVPGEFQALDFFIENLHAVVGTEAVPISLRPHPSDPLDKYTDWMQSHPSLNIQLDAHASLNEAIANARWVVGAETFAMVVASVAGRTVCSSLPPWSHRCRLPIEGLIHLQDLA